MRHVLFGAIAALATAASLPAAEPTPAMQAFLADQIRPWAEDPVIVAAIAAQNARTAGHDQAMIDQLDTAWRAEVGTASAPLVDAVLNSEAAGFLRDRVAQSGGVMTEVFIVDARGLNVAASSPTSDYWQGDEAKFQQTYTLGANAVHFSEIAFDESSQSFQAQISLTITDPASGDPIGAMTVGVLADALM